MDIDSDNGLSRALEALAKLAAGGEIDSETWQFTRDHMLDRLDENAREAFPIPNLPLPRTQKASTRLMSPLPSSPLVTPIATSPMEHDSSQEANKENAPARPQAEDPAPEMQQLGPGELPQQIETMLQNIKDHLKNFDTHPPHTIQRLSELISRPRLHYRALAPYLHAVDRVATVTSSTKIYPLPPAIPDMSSISINGEEADPAAAVGWANPTNSSLAADEALGGALLTPIPWLNRSSPDSNDESSGGSGAQIHSESTETIDGPNGMGSIETVSVSVNGVPSTGHARGVTQGELLRQEQRAGVVPVSQLSRSHEADLAAASRIAHEEEEDEVIYNESHTMDDEDKNEDEEEEAPHARGPEEIGAGDIGPQSATTSFVGEGGMESHDIDVEAAVGRRHDAEGSATATTQDTSSAATDSEADTGEPGTKAEEVNRDGPSADGDGDGDNDDDDASDVSRTLTAESSGTKRGPETDIEDAAASNKKQKDDGEDEEGAKSDGTEERD